MCMHVVSPFLHKVMYTILHLAFFLTRISDQHFEKITPIFCRKKRLERDSPTGNREAN